MPTPAFFAEDIIGTPLLLLYYLDMLVLLLADVRGVGRRHEIRSVSDGYARNFLIPKKLAIAADEKGMAAKAEHDLTEAVEIGKHQNEARRLEKEIFTFTMKAGTHGEVFGSVSKKDLEKAFADRGFSGGEINLDHPIKGTGEHVVDINFSKGVHAKMRVQIKIE